jgi:hypothetical protein
MTVGNNKRDEFDEPHLMQAISGVFDSLDQSITKKSRKPFILGFSILVLIVFCSVLWYSYPKEKSRQLELAIPVIRASEKPVKVAIDDRGGMKVNHKDSTVFSALRGSKDLKIENLLEDSELPLPRTEVFADARMQDERITAEGAIESDTLTSTIGTPSSKEISAVTTQVTTSTPETKAVTPVQTAAAPMPSTKPSTKPRTLNTSTEIAEVLNSFAPASGNAKRATENPAKNSGYYVQLGSLTSKSGAAQAWENMTRRFPAQLLSLNLHIEEAYLKDRGTYYRIQGGPVDETKARNICSEISKKRPGGCLVIKK